MKELELPQWPEEEEKERQREHESAPDGRGLECDGTTYRIRKTATDEDMGFEIRFAAEEGWGPGVDYDLFVTQQMTNAELRGILRFGWEMHRRGSLGYGHAVIGTAGGTDP